MKTAGKTEALSAAKEKLRQSKACKRLMKLFDELNSEGVTIVMITHSPEIASYAKRVCNIFDGILTERTDSDRTRIESAGGIR